MNANAPPPPTRWFSLRRRLLALLLGGVTAGWLAAMASSYLDAHHEIDELFDAQLVQVAQTLLALAGEYEGDDDIARLGEGVHRYERKFVFQLWDDEGRLLLRSQQAPETPLSTRDGFSDRVAGEHWRSYRQWDRHRQLNVQVAENHHVREALAGQIAGRLLLPGLFGLPLLGAWIWLATRRSLRPLDRIAGELGRRAPEKLDPVHPDTAPSEVRPLLDAINGLLGRIGSAMDNERRFTADAAHELRTPLAALTTQAEVALRARDDGEREQALRQIVAGGQRASRLVEQLLTLARLDPAALPAMGRVRLDLMAAEVCADHGTQAIDKDIALELETTGEPEIDGNADLLRILLRNLIDNALRYTPRGGCVCVHLDGTTLCIVDSGPGIAPADRERVLRRFQRLAGQEIEGSGLGLSIVARIAELHGATVMLGEGDGGTGLAVTVAFPAPAAVSR